MAKNGDGLGQEEQSNLLEGKGLDNLVSEMIFISIRLGPTLLLPKENVPAQFVKFYEQYFALKAEIKRKEESYMSVPSELNAYRKRR